MAKRKIDKNVLNAFKNKQQKQNKAKQLQQEIEKQKILEKKEKQRKLEEERIKKEKEEVEKRRKANLIESHKIKIKTLSPIHIGDTIEYEPTEYVIKGNHFYFFNMERVISELIKNNLFSLKNYNDFSISKIVEFFKKDEITNFIIENELYLKKIEVAKDIITKYKKVFGTTTNENGDINQMVILKHISMPYNNLLVSYIPGSSLKGAFQTILNLSVEESKYFKITDTIPKNVVSKIAWSIRDKSIPQKVEVIMPNSELEFVLTIRNKYFYNLKENLENFYRSANLEQFEKYHKSITNKNQFLLKVGRFCGKDFIVKNLKDKPKTKSFFYHKEKDKKNSNGIPFGWILCEIIS